jgi:transposase
MLVTIGIDPHKASVTAVALDPTSTTLGHQRLASTIETAAELIDWAAAWPQRVWAVEGASGLGHGVAQALTSAGERVLDVPAKLAARARLLGSGSARKTDVTDAVSVASVAIHNPRVSVVNLEDYTVVLRLLSDRRDDIVSARTRTKNRLHVLLRDLVPGGAHSELSALSAGTFLAKVRPVTATDRQRKEIARQLLDDIRRADAQLEVIAKTIQEAVVASRSTLPQVQGIGFVLAAKIIGHAGDIARFESKAHFASYTGTAPVEASSGDIRRHRLNRAGNRQLNTAIHTAAVVQARDGGPGRDHYQRKLSESKTPKEAQRSLKRQLSNVVFRHLVEDHQRCQLIIPA